jgi:pimeloyl-ACP methyl ester carboxylesterase
LQCKHLTSSGRRRRIGGSTKLDFPYPPQNGRGSAIGDGRGDSRLRFHFLLFCLLPLAASFGCLPDADLRTTDRLNRGLVVVLPGIEGPSIWNRDLVLGLNDGGVNCAIERHVWGTPIPGGFLINLTDIERNRREADQLRDKLITYMETYPGRPVQLVGHSGGAGIAILTAERMPEDRPLTALFLLAASVAPDYDLRPALSKTEASILNCYSRRDSVLLGPGTKIAGTIDRSYSESAGKVGFVAPASLLAVEQRHLGRLEQEPWTNAMLKLGNDGGHFGWTHRRFVREWLAPKVRKNLRPRTD